MQSFTDTNISRRLAGMPEAQALTAIVLDPQKGCQPHGANNLFIRNIVLSIALLSAMTAGLLCGLLYLLRYINYS